MAKSDKKDLNKVDKNFTWEYNHAKIRDSYVKLIKKLARKPTFTEVAEDCGLSRTTVDAHIKTLEFKPLKHSMRILTEDIILSIANSAKKGSSASQKLWMQICEGWTEKTINEIPGIDKIGELIITSVKKNGTKSRDKSNGGF